MILNFFKSINKEITIRNIIDTRRALTEVMDGKIYHCKTINDAFKKFDRDTTPMYGLEQSLWNLRLLINNNNWNESKLRLRNHRRLYYK